MVKFINRLTLGEMWVAEDRVEEYIAAGHKPAADTSADTTKTKTTKTKKK